MKVKDITDTFSSIVSRVTLEDGSCYEMVTQRSETETHAKVYFYKEGMAVGENQQKELEEGAMDYYEVQRV